MPRRFTLLLLLLPFTLAGAQELDVEETPEVRRYTVEVIIFNYTQDVATGSEIFVPQEAVLEEIPLRDVEPPVIEQTIEGEVELDSDIVIFTEEEYTLGDTLATLERLEVYEPVMHFGWAQSTWPEHERVTLALARFATPPEGLDGELTLYLSRYLHLVVKLQLDEPRQDDDAFDDPVITYGDYRTFNEFEDPRIDDPVRYRIDEDRIFRSGELRYYDHPKFGVLAKVARVEEEPEELEEPEGETELLGYPVE